MEGVNIKLEDLIVNITNFQCMVMRQMVDALNRQSQAVERIDQAFRHFLSFQELKNPQKLVPMAISTPIVNVTPKLEACDDEPPVKMEEMSDPDWEGDDKTEIFCHDCKATFIRGTGHFTRHLKFTSCRPYKCFCGKLFKKKSSLTAHKSTHSTNVHKCDGCSSTFRCRQYLKNHIRRMHKPSADTTEAPQNAMSPSTSVGSASGDNSTFNPLDLLNLQLQ